jgi:hypothetical protein
MTHLDDDPDSFKVCDTEADGAGVTGELYIDQGVWALVGSANDGGDAGCDSFVEDITFPWTYKMVLCWNGTNYCVSKTIEE